MGVGVGVGGWWEVMGVFNLSFGTTAFNTPWMPQTGFDHEDFLSLDVF